MSAYPQGGPPSTSTNQRDEILRRLRAAGPRGVLNIELYRDGESEFRYILEHEPTQLKPVSVFERCSREVEARELPLFASLKEPP